MKAKVLIITGYIAVGCGVLTSACSEIVATHGQIIQPNQLERVKVGVHDKQTVQRLLGSPSATGTLNENRWYYITETTLSKPLNPNLLKERQVVIIEFDANGTVAALKTKDASDGKQIDPNTDVTKTQGQSMGVIDQMLDNLGMGN